MDGQTLFEQQRTCAPNAPGVETHIHQVQEIGAFSDRNGWRTASARAYRTLAITVTDAEGKQTVQNLSLYLLPLPKESSWDQVDPSRTERVLDQEGFFINWANGPGVMYDYGESLWKMSRKDWRSVGQDMLHTLRMFFMTYGVTDGTWPVLSLASSAFAGWYSNPWHWVMYLVSMPVYATFLKASSAWCSGYAMTFQLWREGKVDWTDFDACQKLDSAKNPCTASSPPGYCHYDCCRERDEDNRCVDPLHANDALQYVGAMQGKMFTGEFMGHLVPAVINDFSMQSRHDVERAVETIEDAIAGQNGTGMLRDKVLTMFASNYSLAHSIAPVRTQKLGRGVHRVYVYDPNKEGLSYGLKCVDGRYTSNSGWNQNCGFYGVNGIHPQLFYSSNIGPLNAPRTKEDGSLESVDPLGGVHRELFDYILLMQDSFLGVPSGQFHFDEDYRGKKNDRGFMFYLEPQVYHGNPLVLEGWLMFLVSLVGEGIDYPLEEWLDVQFEDLDDRVEEMFASAWEKLQRGWRCATDWDCLADWKKSRRGGEVAVQLPAMGPYLRMYHFQTPSAKRVRLARKVAHVPYQAVLSGGGADTLVVHGFSGEAGRQDELELHPGFHLAKVALDGVREPYHVSFLSVLEKERRDADGNRTGTRRKEGFLAMMKVKPLDGDQPRLEMSFSGDGSRLRLQNTGETAVEIDLGVVNSFDPEMPGEPEETREAVRQRLELPNRRTVEPFALPGNTAVEIAFGKWWDLQGGHMRIQTMEEGTMPKDKKDAAGCSCATGRRSGGSANGMLAMLAGIVLWMRRRGIRVLGLLGLLVVFYVAGGCFSSPPPESYLFGEIRSMVVKVDLKDEGICRKPLFFVFESNYEIREGLKPEHYNTLYSLFVEYDWSSLMGAYPGAVIHNDGIIAIGEDDGCFVVLIHRKELSEYYTDVDAIAEYSADFIPMRLHVKNLCTQKEYHYEGTVPTFESAVLPECQKMFEGYHSSDIPKACLQAIPTTMMAQYTPATDFDWSQYPLYERYKNAYDCEAFE